MKADRDLPPIDQRDPHARSVRISHAVALGLPGIIAVVLLVPAPPGIPAPALAVNPMILLCSAALAGAYAAPKLGFRSFALLGDLLPIRSLLIAIGCGILLGLSLAGLDCAVAPVWQSPGSSLPALCEPTGFSSLVLGLLYGGVTEELIMRWGGLSILALVLSKVMPTQWSLGLALILSAALFTFAHLPALWLVTPDPTTAVMIRTLVLNCVVGLVFGGIYLRSGLEAAMCAHIGFHCAVFASGLVIEWIL